MRYIIYGAGGIGGGIGADLHRHGHDVVLIARGAQLEAVQANGLTLTTPDGSETYQITAVAHPSELTFSDDDVVILTMKSQDTRGALEDLAAMTSDVPIFGAQNGVENERMALRCFPRVYGTVVNMPATYLEPGVVVVHATPNLGVLDSGRYPEGIDEISERVTGDLNAGGFLAEPDAQVMRRKYSKLLTNLGNATAVVCGPDEHARELQQALMAEAVACYEAVNIDWMPPPELETRRAEAIHSETIPGRPPREGSSSWQSMLRDTGSSEVDFLNGEIVLLGALYGVPTPLNSAIQQMANECSHGQREARSTSSADVLAIAR